MASPSISVESDGPNDTDIIQAIPHEDTIIIEGKPSAASIKAKPKRYQPPAGITNFFQQLPKDNTQTSSNRSSNVPGDEPNKNVDPKKSSWTD